MQLFFFFFNDPPPTEISPLPLHAALPISPAGPPARAAQDGPAQPVLDRAARPEEPRPGRRGAGQGPDPRAGRGSLEDRKSTRLNSSHANISYAVFCLKKKKNKPYVIS